MSKMSSLLGKPLNPEFNNKDEPLETEEQDDLDLFDLESNDTFSGDSIEDYLPTDLNTRTLDDLAKETTNVSRFDSEGKVIDDVPVSEIDSIWVKLGGTTVTTRLEIMGSTNDDIIRFHQFRFAKTALIAFIPVTLSLLFKEPMFLTLSFFGALAMWFIDYFKVQQTYKVFQYKRQLDFNLFVRQLMPYLRGSGNVLYQSLHKMKDRLDDGTTKTALITLITQMNTDVESREPYERFAQESSGQDEALLIMRNLYDYQRSSNDATTIKELGTLVDVAMEGSIDDVIKVKDERFEIESYLIGFAVLIPVLGYAIGFAINTMGVFPLFN